jgi:hypothetical protein
MSVDADNELAPDQIALRDSEDIEYAVTMGDDGVIFIYYEIFPVNGAHPYLEDDLEVVEAAEGRKAGFLFVEGFSPWEPHGEVGDVHVSRLHRISAECFALAREMSWPQMDRMRDRDDPAHTLYLRVRRDLYAFGAQPE